MKFAPARTHEQFQARNPSRMDLCKGNLEFPSLPVSRGNLLYLRSVQVCLCPPVLPTRELTILLETNRLYKPHTITMTTAAPQGNEIRASEDPRAILSPSPAQIRHDHAKFDQPAPRPKTLTQEFSKHRRFPDLSVTESCSICIEIIYLSATYLY